jgi:hypothetical protein
VSIDWRRRVSTRSPFAGGWGMQRATLMFAVMLALLVNACSAMHARSDYAVDGGLALGGQAGSPDDARAAGGGLALSPAVRTIVGHLLGNEVKEAPPSPVAQAPPSPRSETVEARGPQLDLDRPTPHPDEGNGLWLRPSAVLRLLGKEGR